MASSSQGGRDGGQGSSRKDDAAPPPDQKFFCHICRTQVDHVPTDYSCPRCKNGFLEEVIPLPESRPLPSNAGDPLRFQQFLNQLLGSGQQNDMLNAFLQQLVQNLNTEGGASIRFQINTGDDRPPIVFPGLHGNPGDYAWGPGGVDQIVTQLLNQFEGGAPPLRKDEIKKIPKIEVSADQVGRRMQCTTCMEDFVLAETIRQLYCGHCFHEDCIVPWLQRHNTCPICRKAVRPGSKSSTANGSANSADGPSDARSSHSNVMDAIDELD